MLVSGFSATAQTDLSRQNENQMITHFPFRQFSGGVMVVRACFENIKDSFNFILDTGSGGISLDSSTCAAYHINTQPTDTLIKGIAGIKKVRFAFNKTLHFPGLTIEDLNFHINDYSILASVYGEHIDGIIGYSFFRRYIIETNFDSLQVRVYPPGDFTYHGKGYLLHPRFTTLPIQEFSFKDARRITFPFYLDAGAGLCFLMSEKLVADSNVLLSKRKPILTQVEGLGGMLKMRLTVVKELRIGPYRFRKVPSFLYDDVNQILSYPVTGGVVGNDLLRRFNVTYNYPKREVYLRPNSHFNESFDYVYTGLGIYWVDGKVMVLDVIEGSPAEKAGIKPGDEIIGIDNLINQPIQVFKNALQVRNKRIRIIVFRNGALMEIKMKTGSIY